VCNKAALGKTERGKPQKKIKVKNKMKKSVLFALTALGSLALVILFTAQTPPPGGVGIVTPTPTATPTGLTIGAPTTPTVYHYNITQAQLAGITGTTSGDFTITTLPANTVIDQTLVKPYVAVTGTSISAATGRVITANNNYGTAYNIHQTVGATVFDFDGTHPAVENIGSTTPLLFHVVTTGANMSAISAGSIDVWVTMHQLP
jgi:hypothetical protein